MRPSELEHWSTRDLRAASALLQYEDSLGPCGHPHFATGGDAEGWYEVHADQFCWACAAIDEYREANEKVKPLPGQLIRVIDTRLKPQQKE